MLEQKPKCRLLKPVKKKKESFISLSPDNTWQQIFWKAIGNILTDWHNTIWISFYSTWRVHSLEKFVGIINGFSNWQIFTIRIDFSWREDSFVHASHNQPVFGNQISLTPVPMASIYRFKRWYGICIYATVHFLVIYQVLRVLFGKYYAI